MEDQGMEPGDINFVDLPPPDMPSALAAGAIDAYFIGEPHAAKAESRAPDACSITRRISGRTSSRACWWCATS